MSFDFILSQILMLIAFGLIIFAFQVKEGNKFRILFVISAVFAGTHFLLLGAFTAAIVVFINGLRWLTSIFYKKRVLMFVFLGIVLASSYWTYTSLISILPIIAGFFGTIAAFQNKELTTRKILFGATGIWIIHNILVLTPVGIVSEIAFLISNIIGYRKVKKEAYSLERLKNAIEKSWSRDTCYEPQQQGWSSDNQSMGQCYVTTLVVNDYLGGVIMKAKSSNGISHYWNKVDGKEIDFTKGQFPENEKFNDIQEVARRSLEENGRYRVLKERVAEILKH